MIIIRCLLPGAIIGYPVVVAKAPLYIIRKLKPNYDGNENGN